MSFVNRFLRYEVNVQTALKCGTQAAAGIRWRPQALTYTHDYGLMTLQWG